MDARATARLLERALRQERTVVALVEPVTRPGPHLLEAELGGGRIVRVLAEPAGPPQKDGQALDLRVADRGQMAEILALIEFLDHKKASIVAPVATTIDHGVKKPPPGSTLESRIAAIEDSPTGAMFLPDEPPPSGHGGAPEKRPPESVEVEVDDPYDDDDAPTLMQTPMAGKVDARLETVTAPAARPYVPTLALALPPDPVSLADTLMPPSSFVERTLLLPLGNGSGPSAFSPTPAAGAPPASPVARAVPIPREEPSARVDARADVAGISPAQPPAQPGLPRVDARAEPGTRPPLPPTSAPIPKVPTPAHAAAPQSPAAPAGPAPAPGLPAPNADPPTSNPRLIGRTIAGKYTIESSIGRGATAEVFRAQHASLKRPVAIKILHQENAGYLQFVKRFKAEAHTLSKLEHQNIARVIDFGQEPDGLLYLVMELLVGKSLEVVVAESGKKLSVLKVLDVGVQTCNALAFAHDEGVIHRDVKPENVVLVPHRDEDGKPCDLVKVCDFGLAKLRDPDPENTDITMGGTLCGSPAYMSPEQILGEKLDARTDLYALGTMLFESLTGELPHDAIGLTQLFAKKLMEPPTPLRTFLPDVDPGLETAIMRALSRERNDRQDDARVLRQELRAVLSRLRP